MFVDNQVRIEDTRAWEQTLHEIRGLAAVTDQHPEDLFQAVTNDYRPGPSSMASPMQRLTSIGESNDTMPWLARQALDDARVSPSSPDLVRLRSLAAGLAASELVPVKNPMGLEFRTARKGLDGDLVRVRKKMIKRNAGSSMVVHADKSEKSD